MRKFNFSKIIKIFITPALILFSVSSAQRQFDFQNISVADGLSSSVVTAIHQDKYGFLWICTNDGLNRYDGFDFKVFKNNPDDPTSLGFNFLSSVTENKDGSLWFGSQQAISYNRATNTFTSVPISVGNSNSTQFINYLLVDSRDRLWAATERHSLQLFDKETGNFTIIPLDLEGAVSNTPQGEGRFAGSLRVIKELKNGNIIVSDTSNGIFIYDEQNSKLRPYFSIPGILDIYEDELERLWLAGPNSVYRYSPVSSQLLEFKVSEENSIGDITFSGFLAIDESELYVTSNRGIFKISNNNNRLIPFNLEAKNLTPRHIIKDKFNVYWIPTLDRGLLKFDPQKEPFRFYHLSKGKSSLNDVVIITPDPANREQILVATRAKQVFRFNLDTRKHEKILDLGEITLLKDYNIRAMAADFMGRLWLADDLNKKLVSYDIKKQKYQLYDYPNVNYQSLARQVNSIKIDSQGFPWIVSAIGLLRFDPLKKTFTPLPQIANKKISDELRSRLGKILKTYASLAVIEKAGENISLREEFSLSDSSNVLFVSLGEGQINVLQTMFDYGWLEDGSGKRIWVMNNVMRTLNAGGGFKNRFGLKGLRLGPGDYSINYITDVGHSYGNWNVPPPPDSTLYGIRVIPLPDSEFIAVNSFIETELDTTKHPAYEFPFHLEFSKKKSNTIWISTGSNGLIRFNYKDSTYIRYLFGSKSLTSNLVFRSFEDSQGIIWLSTGGGLIRVDPETKEYDQFHEEDGLASNAIFFITEDLKGDLWLGTSGGISRLNKNAPRDDWYFVNYDSRDGLRNYPNSPAVFLTETGEILYGGNAGLNAFNPGEANTIEPEAVIHSLSISDVPLYKSGVEIQSINGILDANEIELGFDQNDLSFEFASLHFCRPYKNKIAYKLTGFNNNWINTTRRFVSFTNLDPGRYDFRIKAANGDGVWSSAERVLKITIHPPWWRTVWAYFAYIIIFFVFLFAFRRFEIQRKMKNAKLKESQLRTEAAELQAKASEMQVKAAEAQNRVVQAENERKTRELEDARELQLSMLPKEIPALPNLDIAVYMKTATEVGGDYYDFHVDQNGILTVVIGDATGHGLNAGMMVTATKSLFGSYADNEDILQVFKGMNHSLKRLNIKKVSMCLSILKIEGNKMRISTAGMPPALIFRSDKKELEEFVIKGMPLGTFMEYPYELHETTLNPGDTILLSSDGYPELFNDKKELFGYERVHKEFSEIAGSEPEIIIEHLKNTGSAWVNDKNPNDDVTFVVIKIK